MAIPRDLTRAVVLFSGMLRAFGLRIATSAIVDAVNALRVVDLMHRRDVYLALRTVLVSRVEEQAVFDRCFDAFWKSHGKDSERLETLLGTARAQREQDDDMPSVAGPRNRHAAEAPDDSDLTQPSGSEVLEALGGSDYESLMQQDFSTFSAEQLEEVLRLTTQIAKRLARRLGRRREPAREDGEIDLRRSIRANLMKGEIIELRHRAPRRDKVRLVLLCDVSGSMDLYSRFLLQFIYALQNSFSGVETFTFATRLTRVSDFLRDGPYRQSLGRLTEVRDWSGGTRIGESLREFNQTWRKLADPRTIVIVISDGWDTGDPDLLAEEMLTLKRRMGRIIWLNPLLGNPSYEPLTRGMTAALNFVDHFAAAHNLASLRDLASQLTLR